jgi:hypothetical protein
VEKDYYEWKEKYLAAKASLTNREEKVRKVLESFETNMEVVGVTGVEGMLISLTLR